ncbi:MAG: 3-oxoacyl-[acyl-carrier-protein] synthase III C-terminal domain-containing protein [Planctomycetota bacterium]
MVGGERVMLVGFGVGYSWSAAVLRWVNARDVA